jgi:UDP-4-amino-4-deoxy-L-arabinose-oxoglutarate aminotransferase
MRKDFLPFTRPYIAEQEIEGVVKVLRSGWITNGPENSEFEKKICTYTGSGYAVALSSATAGMHLLLHAMNIGPGDEVITPSLTWVSTINMIELTGAKPVFADVDEKTLMVTPDTIAECISERTKLIIPVHYAGVPADIDGIKKAAGNIPVAEDAAHALGSFYKERHVGKGGTAIYSFHAIKNITTAEGGMFVTDDEKLAGRIRTLKFHGIGMDAFDRENKGRSPQAEVLEPGFKYNMTDIQAVIGSGQLDRIEEITKKRTEIAQMYMEKLKDIDEILLPEFPEDYKFRHAWHLFIIRLNTDKICRDDFMSELKKMNIGTGLHFRAVHSQKYYRNKYPEAATSLPATERLNNQICSLPLFPAMTENDVSDTADAIKTLFSEKRS